MPRTVGGGGGGGVARRQVTWLLGCFSLTNPDYVSQAQFLQSGLENINNQLIQIGMCQTNQQSVIRAQIMT